MSPRHRFGPHAIAAAILFLLGTLVGGPWLQAGGPSDREAGKHPRQVLIIRGMVQERPFSGSTWDLSADPDRSRALERVYVSPWLPCWGFSSARTACTPEAPASERAAHPSATPQDSCRLDWGRHCAGTGGGSGRTAATSSSPCPIAAAGRSSCAAGC